MKWTIEEITKKIGQYHKGCNVKRLEYFWNKIGNNYEIGAWLGKKEFEVVEQGRKWNEKSAE